MVVATNQALRCAITDLLANEPALEPQIELDRAAVTQAARLRGQLRRWAVGGIDFVQLREKQLHAGELLELARAGMRELHALQAGAGSPLRPHLLVNGRPDIAAAARADGVHLTARRGELSPAQVRQVFAAAGLPRCIVSVSCHTRNEVAHATDHGADLILFGPVFEKLLGGGQSLDGTGLEALRTACQAARGTPVLALGGVTTADWSRCRDAGAAGIAGIRLFR